MSAVAIGMTKKHRKIKGTDNPTSQLLPIISRKVVAGTGKEAKGKEAVKDREVKTVVSDKVECERWCVTKKDGVCVCDKAVCERWCVCVCESCV